jgi:HEAT repeat protein
LLELRSGDVARVRAALAAPLPVSLTDEVVRLLHWVPVIPDATRALDGAGAIAVPALGRALLDGTAPFAVRRRVALLLGRIAVPEARDALMAGLEDPRFEVRYRCGRALARLASADRALAPPSERVLALVGREVDVSRRVWDGRQLVALLPDEGPRELLGVALQERTDRALEHVFRLLALCLPAEPVLAAFRGLQSEDLHIRGTALDYLESVVPAEIRVRLWRVLEGGEAGSRVVGDGGPTADAAADGVARLLRDQESLAIRVDELRRERADG